MASLYILEAFLAHPQVLVLTPLSHFLFLLHQLCSLILVHPSLHFAVPSDDCVASFFCVLPTTLWLILPPCPQLFNNLIFFIIEFPPL